MTRRSPVLAVLAALSLAGALSRSAAFAGDPPAGGGEDPAAPVKAVLAEISAAKAAKDDGALATAINKVAPLYKGTQDAALRGSLASELGNAVKSDKLFESRKAALKALVEIEDPKVGWKQIQGIYPDNDGEDPEKWGIEIVKAVGALHPDAAIKPLLETFHKAKLAELAAAAVTALGNYHASKERVSLLEEIVKIAKLQVPSKSSTKNASPETVARWSALEPAIGKALDTLTGQTVGNVTTWFTKVDEAKKNLKSLFKD